MCKTIMIHHIHGDGFDPVAGSIDINVLKTIIDRFGDNRQYTFDDRLPCQILAADLLDKKGIKGTFFINHHNEMEQDRAVRESFGNSFYDWFFPVYGSYFEIPELPVTFLAQYDFYSFEDRMYRYIRDIHDPKGHDYFMSDHRKPFELLDLDLIKHHELGLHSYSHPRRIAELSYKDQLKEYAKNLAMIPGATKVAYPMGSYNDDTFGIMQELGIETGYIAENIQSINPLTQPRIDIALWK